MISNQFQSQLDDYLHPGVSSLMDREDGEAERDDKDIVDQVEPFFQLLYSCRAGNKVISATSSCDGCPLRTVLMSFSLESC